jgi:hypothetical protein
MAKRSARSGEKENKSAAIRDYIRSHSEAGPTAIADALNAAHGWKISPAYVSTIKNKMQEKKASRRRGRAAAGGVDESALMQAKKMAQQIGSIGEAKAALDLLSRLTS